MIGFLRGILAEKGDGYIIVDVGGVGYFVNVPSNTGAYLKAEGEEVMVHTAMIVREDDMSLYGFSTRGELDAFKKLKKKEEVSEDEIADAEEELQKITDKYVKKIDKVIEQKTKELMTI